MTTNVASLADQFRALLPVTPADHPLHNASLTDDTLLRQAMYAGVGAENFEGQLQELPTPPAFQVRGARSAMIPPANTLGPARRATSAGALITGGFMGLRADGGAVQLREGVVGQDFPITSDPRGPRSVGLSPELCINGALGKHVGDPSTSNRPNARADAAMQGAARLTADSPHIGVATDTELLAAARAGTAGRLKWSYHDIPRASIVFTKGGAFVSARGGGYGSAAPNTYLSLRDIALSDGMGPLLAAEAERVGMLEPGPPVPYLDSLGQPRLYLCSYLGAELTSAWREYAQNMAMHGVYDAGGDINGAILRSFGAFLEKVRGKHATLEGQDIYNRWFRENAAWAELPDRDVVQEADLRMLHTDEDAGLDVDGTRQDWAGFNPHAFMLPQLAAYTGLPIGQGMTQEMARVF